MGMNGIGGFGGGFGQGSNNNWNGSQSWNFDQNNYNQNGPGMGTGDSRQDTIKVIMVNSMTIAATISDVVVAVAEVSTEATVVEAISSEATPIIRTRANSLNTDQTRMARAVSTRAKASKWTRMAKLFKETLLKKPMKPELRVPDKLMDPVRS
jgi:hypothetical protein